MAMTSVERGCLYTKGWSLLLDKEEPIVKTFDNTVGAFI
jgi:hypothetical protein